MRQFRCIGIQVLSLVISIICAIDGKLFRSRGYLKDPKSDPTLGDPPTAQWFDQKLDHFQPTSYEITWKQRYFVNDSFYTNGSPAFIMIGGEGPANPIWSIQGSWIEYAKSVGAICFQLEHRYYGESHPTMDLSVKNLYYLNSEQALADIANFVSYMNTQYNISKWIAFGGSYPGTLASWIRYKYPHLIHGAVSTSGPVLAKSDFYEYLIVVDQVFKVTDPKCGPAVQEGMFEIERLLQHQVGMRELSKMFKTCNTLNANKAKDVSTFIESVIGNFEDIVQYNKDNRAFEGADNSDITIDTLCKIMVDESIGQPIERLASVNDLILRRVEKTECLDASYTNSINSLGYHNWTGESSRQWIYQTCTEFGWYQSSNQTDHPYSNYFPAKFFEDQCIDIFGTHFNKKLLENGIRRTNLIYGGKNPTGITNIVYVHGSFDPWHAMGITKDLSEKATAIFITGTAHCANMYPESSQDPYQLKEARKEILKKIKSWLE
ncbi:putative serine protease F56F10.1 [Lepeophtheirus salmonis]|uniref:putative serine protease F56F10.1 n=1 Tax=Lepeophtheirus salmonis TaxID=72036 RepID=UPI001AEB36AE|nr:putative serine protease F56F10.1 [Lepeophtheirus salmonis]